MNTTDMLYHPPSDPSTLPVLIILLAVALVLFLTKPRAR